MRDDASAALARAPARKPRRLLPWVGIGLAAVLAIAVNVIAELAPRDLRLDLTERQLYTLAPGTREVVGSLREPITLRLYYSRKLGRDVPQYGTFAERVRDVIQEYVRASNGKLVLEEFDPIPFSDAEDRAMAYGLQGVPLDQSGEQVYFGLAAINLTDDERTIPFFQPERERFLEYDLTRILYELSGTPKPVVGVMSALPMNGEMRAMQMGGRPTPPWASMTQLRQFFTVRDVATDAKTIDPEIRTLWVVHPQGLSEATQFAIDQFVLRGGRLVVFVDPHSEAQAMRPGPRGQPVTDTASNLPKLFQAWGVAYDPNQVAGDLRGAWRVRAGQGERVQAVDYVAWFNAQGDSINRDTPITGELNQITFASTGFLRAADGATTRFEPLVITSTEAQVIPASEVRTEPNPSRILASFRPSGERYTLAARVSGPVQSAFQGDLPEGVEAPAERLTEAKEPVNILVVADADVLEDRFWVRVQDFFGQQVATPFSDNGAFVTNATELLSGSAALIGLRSRGESTRPFILVEGIRREAERAFREREQVLTRTLEETERKLRELRSGASGPGADRRAVEAMITPEQRAAIDQARQTIGETRRELRQVQFDLRRDIDALKNRLQFWNVAAVPIAVMVFALGLGLWRRSQRQKRSAA
jgi:ABC-type uncharacterized transport system involved in gliding motility auxiliary subunit